MNQNETERLAADTSLLREAELSPMAAVEALYSGDDDALARAIVADMSDQIFAPTLPLPASRRKRRLARISHWLLGRTVRTEYDGDVVSRYRSRILERSRHPYARTLLEPSAADAATFVEGGDPMNAPYMMLSPEVAANAGTWDRLLLGSVHARDVQLRFAHETRFTHELAKRHLDRGQPVRMRALAAGTGLSMILACDRLIRDGYDPELIDATVTDRDPANVERASRLIAQLQSGLGRALSTKVEDLTESDDGGDFHVITLVGILEYFSGFTCTTTHEHLDEQPAEEPASATDILSPITPRLAADGALVTNSYRPEIGARILEIFGKKLFYRTHDDLSELLASVGLGPGELLGSGHVYDVGYYTNRAAL